VDTAVKNAVAELVAAAGKQQRSSTAAVAEAVAVGSEMHNQLYCKRKA